MNWKYRRAGESTIKTSNLWCGICGDNEFYINGGDKYGSLECKRCGAGVEDNPGYGWFTSWPAHPNNDYIQCREKDSINFNIYTGEVLKNG